MANYAHTKDIIAQNIYTNHEGRVTAEMVKTAADEIVNTLIAGGYLYAGIAHPGDAAVTPDANVFYIATEAGTYTNKGGLVVNDGEVAVLKYNGTWSKEVTGAATAAQVTELGQKVGVDISSEKTATVGATTMLFTADDLKPYTLTTPVSIYIESLSVDSIDGACLLYVRKNIDDSGSSTWLSFAGITVKEGMTLPLTYITEGYKVIAFAVQNPSVQFDIKIKVLYDCIENDIRTNTQDIQEIYSDVDEIRKDIGIELVSQKTVGAGSSAMLFTTDDIQKYNFVSPLSIYIEDLTGVSSIDGQLLSYHRKDIATSQGGWVNAYGFTVTKGAKIPLIYITDGYILDAISISNTTQSSFTIKVQIIYDNINDKIESLEKILERDSFIPKRIPHLVGKPLYIYPANLIAIDNKDKSIAICARNKRSNPVFTCIASDTRAIDIKLQVIMQNTIITDLPDIPVTHFTPSAPDSDLFILTFGDSLMLGANLSYNGCINNELSRLLNGTGKAIENGDPSLGYSNIHVIGTLESGDADAPIKHEGRGGWSVDTYLRTQSLGGITNAFYNPNKQGDIKFDLDYYLTQNGFYNDGVASDGSNLIVGIMLNWNSDPFDSAWENDYAELIENIHATHSNAKILLLGCNCPCEIVNATYSESEYASVAAIQSNAKKRVIKYENILEGLSAQYDYCYHVPILPYFYPDGSYIPSGQTSSSPAVYYVPRNPTVQIDCYADGVHPNLIGYGQIADVIRNYICYHFLT